MAFIDTAISILSFLIPILAGLFVFWSDSKKDGFDQEKVYDLLMFGLVGSVVTAQVAFMIVNRSVYFDPLKLDPFSLVFGFVFALSFIVLKRRWSIYRVLDNLSIAFVMLLAFLLLTINLKIGFKPLYLVASLLLFVSYGLLQKYRGTFLKSGFVYCLISGVLCLAAAALTKGTISLIFLGLLFTLTLAVLIYRVRSLYARSKVDNSSPHNL